MPMPARNFPRVLRLGLALQFIAFDDRGDPDLFNGYFFLFIRGESGGKFVGFRPSVYGKGGQVKFVIRIDSGCRSTWRHRGQRGRGVLLIARPQREHHAHSNQIGQCKEDSFKHRRTLLLHYLIKNTGSFEAEKPLIGRFPLAIVDNPLV
jgi:hypothetical protein